MGLDSFKLCIKGTPVAYGHPLCSAVWAVLWLVLTGVGCVVLEHFSCMLQSLTYLSVCFVGLGLGPPLSARGFVSACACDSVAGARFVICTFSQTPTVMLRCGFC